jgi:hypothetical protein
MSVDEGLYFSYYSFLFWDYLTLVIFMCAGICYGLWVGSYWYKEVYSQKTQVGFMEHLHAWVWGKPSNLSKQADGFQHKLEHVAVNIEKNLQDLENLAEKVPLIVKPTKELKASRIKTTVKKVTAAKPRKPRVVKKAKAAS